jgi:hypothetical protein
MTNKQLAPKVRAWLKGTDVGPEDVRRSVGSVSVRAEHTRQRGRWWPLPSFRRGAASQAARTDTHPSPIPATNGHAPTVIGRTSSMLSPAKAITAGALVFAIGGVILIAQPFQQQSNVPGAVSDTPPQPPAEFTGTWCIGPAVSSDRAGTETSIDVGEDGMTLTRYQDGAWSNTVTMSDPRLEGDAFQTWESDTYQVPGMTTGPGLVAATLSIVNEDGAWVSTDYEGAYPDGSNAGTGPTVLLGQGGYEGLVAMMTTPAGPGDCSDVHGVIFDQPPVPEPYLPE